MSRDLKVGRNVAGHRDKALSYSPPQPHASEEGRVLRNREASGAQSLKLDSSKNRGFKGLQSKKR